MIQLYYNKWYSWNSGNNTQVTSDAELDSDITMQGSMLERRTAVMKGYLKPMDAIPSVRKLALELKITPGTVAKAYQELERQHMIMTIRGKGTFIADEITVKPDETKIMEIRKQLTTEIMELKMMGYNREHIVELVKEIYEEMSI